MGIGDIAALGLAATLGEMYITLMPIVFAGVLNMAWCKLSWPASLKRPIDGGKNWRDGRRILGDNKTWLGFGGMMLFSAVSMIIWGMVCADSAYLSAHNYFYRNYPNTLTYNILAGLCAGFAYALFELPNSFLKRRLGIAPGKRLRGKLSSLFVVLDQADSIIGVVLAVTLFYPMSLPFCLIYILVGTATHIVMNMLLYAVRLRNNPF